MKTGKGPNISSSPARPGDVFGKAQPSDSERTEALSERFAAFFGMPLTKVRIDTSYRGLLPWEAACCFTGEDGESRICLKPPAARKWTSAFGPSFEAVIVHEAIHATRADLHSTVFEEFCAYDGCRAMVPSGISRLRVFLGPFFSSFIEVLIFLLACWLGPVLLCFCDGPWWMTFLAPFGFLSWHTLRLVYRWRVWKRACSHAQALFGEKMWHKMIRLTDKNVFEYACRSP